MLSLFFYLSHNQKLSRANKTMKWWRESDTLSKIIVLVLFAAAIVTVWFLATPKSHLQDQQVRDAREQPEK